MHTKVLERRAVNVFGLADLGADATRADDVGNWNELEQCMEDTTSAGRLGDLALHVARKYACDEADKTVFHTTEQVELPLAHPVEH